MTNHFNSYMTNLDTGFLREYCIRYGDMKYYEKGEFFLRHGEIFPFVGFVESGIFKYTCANISENKEYNIGFSFPGEFVADYPSCLYGAESKVSIQALVKCKVYICPVEQLMICYENGFDNQNLVRVVAEQLFVQVYSRYMDMYRLTPEERYVNLLDSYPDILQLIPLKEIASFLKITPVHMSRIRRKIYSRGESF